MTKLFGYRRLGYTIIVAAQILLISWLWQVKSAQAYTVNPARWQSQSTNYYLTNNFVNSGSGWSGRGRGAGSDWTGSVAPFSFGNGGSNYIQSGSLLFNNALAVTETTINGQYYIIKFITTVNTGNGYAFYDGTQGPSVPVGYYDLQSVLRHELGHALGLCHSNVGSNPSSLLMYGGIYPQQIKFIDNDAINGTRHIYTTTGTAPTGPCDNGAGGGGPI